MDQGTQGDCAPTPVEPQLLGNEGARGAFFITCEHASNRIPDEIPVSARMYSFFFCHDQNFLSRNLPEIS